MKIVGIEMYQLEFFEVQSELKRMQGYPLELKIAKAKTRIHEFVKHCGEENVYVSFSGGKDSTVLLDIVRQEYPDIPAVFCDTGLEYPEIKEFVKTFDNVEIIRPAKTFKEVITKYGYPIISKEQAQYIYEIRHGKSETTRNIHLYGGRKNKNFKLSDKWHFCLNAPFEISQKCCNQLKKQPFEKYSKQTGRFPIMGILVEESRLRFLSYHKHGCNYLDTDKPKSRPLSIWTNNDILEYIVKNNLKIASVYGDIKQDVLGRYYTTGCERTGCVFCAFGVNNEKCPNRYQRLKQTHPNLWRYCIQGGEFNEENNWIPNKEGLGFGKVLDFLGVPYE